ncbi:hypothetical protein COBT_001131 [Conglomerata obtusa]
MVYENGAYGLYNNTTSIIKSLYNTCTSGIRKNASMFMNHVKLDMSTINDIKEENELGYKCSNPKSNIRNDTRFNSVYKKRCNAEIFKVSKKRKLEYNKGLSCGYCERRKTGNFRYQNFIHCTSNSYGGCDSNKTLNPNTLGGKLNNIRRSTHNLNVHLYNNLLNIKTVSGSSKKYCDQYNHQKNIKKTSLKRSDAKLVSDGDSYNKKKVRNNQICNKKFNKNKGKFIFLYDKISKTTMLKNN